MAGYFAVIDVRVDDADQYQDYVSKAGPLIEKYGGEYLVRGGALTVVEGDYFKPRRLVILRFPSEAAFKGFYHSEEYQAARAIRLPVSDMAWIGVEGYEG